jgi:hypothetical protein
MLYTYRHRSRESRWSLPVTFCRVWCTYRRRSRIDRIHTHARAYVGVVFAGGLRRRAPAARAQREECFFVARVKRPRGGTEGEEKKNHISTWISRILATA